MNLWSVVLSGVSRRMTTKTDSTPSDPRIVAMRFQPAQLTRARELRALTKTELAERVQKTPSAISQFESGVSRPDAETIARLALGLGVPVGFFAKPSGVLSIPIEGCHFRSSRSVSQYSRRQAVRIGELAQELTDFLEGEGIESPVEALTSLKRTVQTLDEIETLALDVRRAWGLGMGPIPRLVALLEGKGVRILPLINACADVDAFSVWHRGVPIVLLAPKAASRMHFDLAHELGHLLMHEDAEPGDAELERQADSFASAFLLPQDSFLDECPARWRLSTFQALKKRWFVSIQALVVRAHRLGRLSPASYRRAFVELNQLGLRRNEPDEWMFEQPVVLRKSIELVGVDWPLEKIAAVLSLHESHLREVLTPVLSG
ncbi:ImmA/IrrE family metallo-endopeptidase [Corallococcus coralloides]|nr:ImmA/IrrE family metallo-endopeptidase [Corallococcus coralloides]